ncbi:hypothetical protein CCR75_003646 [Bremia lactucae]|uniref:Uncharacterized protein n=1 Tax=Bremia lactucae TaxID=4779 RepID=A0A976IL24_BRELC|nr:hypothetical protein CCR75_003646 [Bremia lactucae]
MKTIKDRVRDTTVTATNSARNTMSATTGRRNGEEELDEVIDLTEAGGDEPNLGTQQWLIDNEGDVLELAG